MTAATVNDGELRHFDADDAFLETSVGEEYTYKVPEEYQEFSEAWGC